MCDARLFGPQIDALSARHTIHLAAITGHGSIEALVRDVLAQAPSRFALVGLSMGGIVAMEVVAQAPDRVAGLALLDTNPLAETDAVRAGREPQIRKVRAGRLREVRRDEMKPNYLAAGPRRQVILDLCMDMAESLGPGVFVRQSRALQSRPDQQATLARVSVPTLIACGEYDALCPLEHHQLMHRLVAGSRLEIVGDAGHLPTLEQPAATSSLLADWLGRLD